MIVRDEAHVVGRCLRSVLPLLDHWTVVDTGSSDHTPEVVSESLAALPGRLIHRRWVNFAENRSEALRLAAPETDYLLVIDADDVLQVVDGFDPERLRHHLNRDAYELPIVDGGLRYRRMQVFRSDRNWRYEGVLHEYPVCDGDFSLGILDGLIDRRIGGGARSQRPDKYQRDVVVLREALRSSPDNARYWFYLGQSLRDAGRSEEAIEAYETRAGMSGYKEEIWYAIYQVAELLRSTSRPDDEIVEAYLRAHEARPSRAEPLVRLAHFFRHQGNWPAAFAAAEKAIAMAPAKDRLFLDESAYRWKAMDEYAVAAHQIGRHRLAARANITLLRERLPETEAPRVIRNAELAIDALNPGDHEVPVLGKLLAQTTGDSPVAPATNLPAFAVLGLWRGGTSLVTGVLRALGVDVGGPFFVAETEYTTFEDQALRNVCIESFGQETHDWGPKGTAQARVQMLKLWACRRRRQAAKAERVGIGGKHPVMCGLVGEIEEAWGIAGQSVRFVSVHRPIEDVIDSCRRAAAGRRDSWWIADGLEKRLKNLLDRRESALRERDHVVIDFDELRRTPAEVIGRLAQRCALPAAGIDRAVASVNRV